MHQAMATLSTLLAPELTQPGSKWTLERDINGYARASGEGLATQACAGSMTQMSPSMEKQSRSRSTVKIRAPDADLETLVNT